MLSISTYQLKQGFQQLLTPVAQLLLRLNISANQITLSACVLCAAYATTLFFWHNDALLYLFPIVLFLKIALNAVDGMVAKLSQSESAIGELLNDLCDTLADVMLCLALTIIFGLHLLWLAFTIAVFTLEYASVLVQRHQSERALAGPFGKSDRAIFLSITALLIIALPESTWLAPVTGSTGIILTGLTLFNRVRPIAAC